jgi:putative addiction module component (TIGR02574 family)
LLPSELDTIPGALPEIDAMTLAEELAQKARTLPAEERARLAEELLASLGDAPDAGVEAAWDVEIRRRLDEVESGRVQLVPAEEVFAEVRRLLA